jgi:hypothetical protein
MHIKFSRDKDGRKENFHKIFTISDGKSYLKIDMQSFLTLELLDQSWSKDKTIIIDQKNLCHLIKGCKNILNNIYKEDIFAVEKKSNQLIMYSDMVEKYTEKIYNLGSNQRVLIKPAIITDENETTYEGVMIYINKTDNFVELPIDAFEALVYALEKIDLFVYSQQLINYYIASNEKVDVKEISMNSTTTNKKQHPLFKDEEVVVQGNLNKKDEDPFNFKN